MKYQPPVNSVPNELDPEPVYVNGDPAAGRKGSIPPAKAIEHPMRELLNLIVGAGLTPDEADLTQVLQAVRLLAAGAGSNPGAPAFLFNPVYPEIVSNGGVMSIAAANGQIVLAAGQQWVHRGGVLYNSSDLAPAQRTKATVPSKTYHLRWRFNAGAPTLALYDLADAGYNAGAKAETDIAFDSSYDDMLIARVVTNPANDPTVTPLINRHRLAAEITNSGATSGVGNISKRTAALSWNWARRPLMSIYPSQIYVSPTSPNNTGFTGTQNHDHDIEIRVDAISRYGASIYLMRDYSLSFAIAAQISA
ncbi:hypothetical protein [Mesorhizobium sp. KR2-14]|uniref:hypothetical protein n=1 Tax=Mesorhizobium sp. KR2-14 TaxID=3156610 RepID=UPI0032B336C1